MWMALQLQIAWVQLQKLMVVNAGTQCRQRTGCPLPPQVMMTKVRSAGERTNGVSSSVEEMSLPPNPNLIPWRRPVFATKLLKHVS